VGQPFFRTKENPEAKLRGKYLLLLRAIGNRVNDDRIILLVDTLFFLFVVFLYVLSLLLSVGRFKSLRKCQSLGHP